VLFSGGLGLVVIQFLPYYIDSPIVWGLELMFVSAGFLVYYFVIRNQQRS
jgi:hypothetical protein